MALTYDSHYFIRSIVGVNTNLVAYQDDTQAIQNFTTSKPLIMLVMYNVMNYHGVSEVSRGKSITIEVDGVDQDGIGVRHDQSMNAGGDMKNACTVYYLGELAAGDHTVKGRFASLLAASTVTISERQLAIFLFEGEAADWGFASSTVVNTNNTDAWADDPNASVAVNLPEDDMIVLALYSASNEEDDSEGVHGKEIAIQVDADLNRGWHGQSPSSINNPNGCTTHLIYSTLGAGAHTFDGRFRSNEDTVTVTIRGRQLAVLVFSPEQLWDQVLDDVTAMSQNVAVPVFTDDTPAVINRNLDAVYEALILYGNYNYDGVVQSPAGRRSTINVDATDYSEGHQAINMASYKDGNTVVHVIALDAGAHTIRGRFGINAAWNTASISRRTLSVLYFPRAPVGPHKQNILQKMMHGGL